MKSIGPGVLALILVIGVGFFFWHKFSSPPTPLTVALKDEVAQVRESAAQQLGTTGDESALDPLIDALNDKDVRVRRAAAGSLKQLLSRIEDPQTRAKAVEPLLLAMRDEDKEVRGTVPYALAKVGEPAIGPIIAALRNEHEQVRKAAARAMQEVLPTLEDPEAVIRGLEAVASTMNDNDTDVRRVAFGALHQLGQRGFEPLLIALKHEDTQVRSAAAISMQFVIPAVEDPQRRLQAIEPLILAMQDEEWEVRRYAPVALAKIGEPALESLLCVILEGDCGERCCDDLCSCAALAIGQILSDCEDGELNRKIIIPLVDRLSVEDQSSDKRANAAYGLSQILLSRFEDPANRLTALSALFTALNDRSQEVRVEAATAVNRVLGGSKDPNTISSAIRPLLIALHDGSPKVREHVAYSLGAALSVVDDHSNMQDAVESLVLLLKDPSEPDAVHEAVASALSWIGTKKTREAVRDAGFDPDDPPTPR